MIELIIVRHGNTFNPGEAPRRVGLKTDMPLSASGIEQAKRLGVYLHQHYSGIDQIITSELQRTQQTAEIAMQAANWRVPTRSCAWLNEIDYGVDENQLEADVKARVGEQALAAWDAVGKVPQGWQFDAEKAKSAWQDFASSLVEQALEQRVMLVTSNGIARFAPVILANVAEFNQQYKLKIPTASISQFHFAKNRWQVDFWGVKPD